MKVLVMQSLDTGEIKRVKETNKYFNWFKHSSAWRKLSEEEMI